MSKKNKSTRIKLIANPGAGKVNEVTDAVQTVTEALQQLGMEVEVALAKPKEEATKIARRAVKKGFKMVIAMGGDGTIEAVMRGMIGKKARLGIIPTGTQNNIAKSLRIPEDLEQACALIASGKAHKLDVGQVKVKKGKKFHFFEIATIGLAATLYPAANKISNGKISEIMQAARTFFEQDARPKVFLTLNDESKVEVETMLVVVSNTPLFGKNFKIAPLASLEDGLLDVSVFPEFNKMELVRYFAAVMDGGYSGDGKVQHYQVRKVRVKSSPKLDVMADGIDLGKGKVKIKVRPGALQVITPLEEAEVGAVEPASTTAAAADHPETSVIALG